jgi:hypothetical protein
MRKFVYAAVFATAISAPALAGALMDHSAVSVLGAPGGCSSSCTVGGADPDNPGNAQGGHFASTNAAGFTQTGSGTVGTGRPEDGPCSSNRPDGPDRHSC